MQLSPYQPRAIEAVSPLHYPPVEMTSSSYGGCNSFQGSRGIRLLETDTLDTKQICHLDRSVAQWRDLRFPGSLAKLYFEPSSPSAIANNLLTVFQFRPVDAHCSVFSILTREI